MSGQKSNDNFNEDLAVSLACLSDLACQITPAKTDGSPAVRWGVVFSKLGVLHEETPGILLFSYIISQSFHIEILGNSPQFAFFVLFERVTPNNAQASRFCCSFDGLYRL